MPLTSPLVRIATVDLDSHFLVALRESSIAFVECADIEGATQLVAANACDLLLVHHCMSGSLGSIARTAVPVLGPDATIVLSALGTTFVPGLFVVDETIACDSLVRLVRRLSHGRDLAGTCACARASESAPTLTTACVFD